MIATRPAGRSRVAARAALTSGPATPPEPTVDPDHGLPDHGEPGRWCRCHRNRSNNAGGSGEHPRPLVQPLPPWLGTQQGRHPTAERDEPARLPPGPGRAPHPNSRTGLESQSRNTARAPPRWPAE